MSRRRTFWWMGGTAALLIATASGPAHAHHSVSMFDTSKSFIFHGTVEKWLWSNPHAWLYVRVEKKDHTQEVWGFEASGTNMLIREGWNAGDINPGDVIAVTAMPGRNGNRIGLLQQVQLPAGRVLKTGFGSAPPDAAPPGPSPASLPPGAPPPGPGILPPPSGPTNAVPYE